MKDKIINSLKILLIFFVLVFAAIFVSTIRNKNIARGLASDICLKITSPDEKNYCLATVNQNSVFCNDISDENGKNNCLATAKRDFSFCDDIRDRPLQESCFKKLSLLTDNPSYCDLSEDKDVCYFSYVTDSYLMSNSDGIKEDYCSKIDNKSMKETCLALRSDDKSICRSNLLCLTFLEKDKSICKGIKGDGKFVCLSNKAITSKDISSCSKITDSKWKDLCYSNYATYVSSNVSDCEYIVNDKIKSSCYLGSAIRLSK